MALIVAIDGPSGVGKTTTSKLVARELNLPHIDTGAMYRTIALAALRGNVDLRDAQAVEALTERTTIEFVPGDVPRVLLDGEDVTGLIRTQAVSMAASDVSAIPAVRRTLVRMQQELGQRHGGVLEGRDIGTKVFPDTPVKFFLTARADVRAHRRHAELTAKGETSTLADVLAQSEARDRQDSSRADSPLMHDDTYIVLDTSELTISEVVDAIVSRVRANR